MVLAFLSASVQAERVARVLYLGASAEEPVKAVVHQPGQSPQEVALARNNFSESFEISAGAIRLYFLPDVFSEGEAFPKSAPSLAIPEGWSKVLILVSKDAKNRVLPIQMKAINASDDQFGPGELYFMNFTKSAIFGRVGEKKLNLKAGSFQIIKEPIKKMGYYRIELDSMGKKEKDRSWLLRQSWVHQPKVRRVVFVLPLPQQKRIKLYSTAIRDF